MKDRINDTRDCLLISKGCDQSPAIGIGPPWAWLELLRQSGASLEAGIHIIVTSLGLPPHRREITYPFLCTGIFGN
jgi:hypothetical protein